METKRIAFCCGAVELGNFGGDSTAVITEKLKIYIDQYTNRDYNKAFLFATTIPEQQEAIEALESCGFIPTPGMHRKGQDEPITLWYRPLADVVGL